MHHTGSHGTRYTVDKANLNKLAGLVQKGRGLIRKWMLTHNAPEAELRAFDLDVFANFVHKTLPDVA
jgi:thiamine biosynthesis protein ThiC